MPPMNNLPATRPRQENITVLTVNSNMEDRLSLERIFDSNGWTIQGAKSIREATQLLKDRPSLILCEKDLPDGNWKDIFREAQRLDEAAPLVVVSRKPDERLWAEVLNWGGFDVLLTPFVRNEVERVMHMAWRHQDRARQLAAVS